MPVGSAELPDGTICNGIIVAGVPVGDPMYVAAHLDGKARSVVSNITAITATLQDCHLQSLHTVAYYCFGGMLHYWAQHCYPAEVAAAAAQVDSHL